jgi:hypothetical protein
MPGSHRHSRLSFPSISRVKKNVQDAVVGSSTQSTAAEVARPAEVVSLLLSQEEMEESLRNQEAKRRRLEQQKVEDGKRGARIRSVSFPLGFRQEAYPLGVMYRDENKKARDAAAAAAAAAAGSNAWSAADDDDAFGVSSLAHTILFFADFRSPSLPQFFSNQPVGGIPAGDAEDEVNLAGAGEPGAGGAPKKKRGRKPKAEGEAAGDGDQPAKPKR